MQPRQLDIPPRDSPISSKAQSCPSCPVLPFLFYSLHGSLLYLLSNHRRLDTLLQQQQKRHAMDLGINKAVFLIVVVVVRCALHPRNRARWLKVNPSFVIIQTRRASMISSFSADMLVLLFIFDIRDRVLDSVLPPGDEQAGWPGFVQEKMKTMNFDYTLSCNYRTTGTGCTSLFALRVWWQTMRE